MGFEHIIGHERAIRLITSMFNAGRLPHALLLTGPEGVGKGALALAVAQAANCLGPSPGAPCGPCSACAKVERGVHPDVSVIEPEGRLKLIKIDTIRKLRQQIAYRPYEGRTKVYIVREAHRMQAQGDASANALLKTLEEPPPSSLLILTAPRETDLLPTIVSRCLRINLAPLSREAVELWLAEHRGITGPQGRLLASMAEGCLGRVIDATPQDLWEKRGEVLDRLSGLDMNRLGPSLDWAAELVAAEESWPMIIKLIRFWYRDLMILAAGGESRHLINEDLLDRLQAAAANQRPSVFIDALGHLDRAEYALNRLVRPELVFENLVLTLAGLHHG
jgi:DNA polymerase III subunit delta'